MNRNEFHYAHTAALMAEALAASCKYSRNEIARLAIEVAYWDAMVDWKTPGHCVPLQEATQVRWQEGAALIGIGGFWPMMKRVHMFHFTPPAVLSWKPDEIRGLETFGTALHAYQDCGEKGCPHYGYVGYPSKHNWDRTVSLGRVSTWQKLLAKIKPSMKNKVWGHALDPEADNIERCREGALLCGIKVFELISGKPVVWVAPDLPKKGSVPHWEDGKVLYSIKSLISLQESKNDKELERQSFKIFREMAGQDLPRFKGGVLDLPSKEASI